MLQTGATARVQVPATSANLGAGFDSFGLALNYYDEHTVTVTAEPGVRVTVIGEGAQTVARDENNLVAQAIRHVFAQNNRQLPGLKLNTCNRIPHGRGMGSSGAAIVAGVCLGAALLQDELAFSKQQLLEYATALEGHPDNVAPAIFGGFTISWVADNTPHTQQLQPAPGVRPLVLVPDFAVPTKVARGLLPETVPHADACFNLARAGLFVTALTSVPELLFTATADRLHQDYRGAAMPDSYSLLKQLRAAGFAATISGAGPSVLVLCENLARQAAALEFVRANASNWRLLELAIAAEGAKVEVI